MLDIKKAVIAGLLQSPDLYVQLADLEPVDFFDSEVPTEKVYTAAMGLIGNGIRPDVALMATETGFKQDYIKKFFDLEVDFENFPVYLNRLIEQATIRRLRSVGRSLLEVSDSNLPEVAERANQTLRQIGRTDSSAKIKGVLEKYLEHALQVMQLPEHQRVIRFNFDDLNRIVGGVYPGKIYVLGGRPGMGKTTLFSQWRMDFLQRGYTVVSFALEMGRTAILQRIIANTLGIPLTQLMEMQITEAQLAQLYEISAKISTYNWTIYDSDCADFKRLRGSLEHSLANDKPQIIDLDFIQLVRGGAGDMESTRISNIMAWLATTISSSPAAILIASQVDRGLDDALNKRPTLKSFKGSGGIEESADCAMGLYRPAFYDKDAGKEAELIVLKNRFGPTETVNLVSDMQHFRFLPAPAF